MSINGNTRVSDHDVTNQHVLVSSAVNASDSVSQHDNMVPSESSSTTAVPTPTPSILPSQSEQKGVAPVSLVPQSLWRECIMVATICFGQLLSLAPLGQVLAPLHIISESFSNQSPTSLSWYLAAYSLTTGTFILVMGRLGDLCGHKLMFAIGYAWLALWSLIAGLSVYTGNQIFFEACRGLQGLGGAILVPNGVALLGMLYAPGPRKAVVFCLFGASGPTGFLTGALFASLVAQLAWWPWAFWLMAIVAVIMFVSVLYFVPNPDGVHEHSDSSHRSWMQRLSWMKQFDWLGAVTGVAGLIFFNVAWNQAPAVGWGKAYVIVLLVLGVVLFAAFLVIERYVQYPLVPVKEISAKVALVLACLALGWGGFGIWVYYWFEFVEVIQGKTPLNAVAQHSAALPAAYTAALVVSRIVLKVQASWIMLGAAIAFFGGSLITVLTSPHTLYWKQLFWSVLLMPFGMDMSFPASTLLLSNLVPKEHQGIGASLVVTTINYSIAFGLGVAGTVQVHFNHDGQNVLSGGRAAQWTGVGMTGAGILVAVYFVISDVVMPKMRKTHTVDVESNDMKEQVDR